MTSFDIVPYGIVSVLLLIVACFTIFYFILAIGEILHIAYDKIHPDYDWGGKNAKRDTNLKVPHGFSIWIVIYFIVVVLLIFVLPIINSI